MVERPYGSLDNKLCGEKSIKRPKIPLLKTELDACASIMRVVWRERDRPLIGARESSYNEDAAG